jgi:hypothetical protein
MHKGVILIVRAADSDDARIAAESFLADYGDGHVWDWYAIGGRWSGTLNPLNAEFDRLAKTICPAEKSGFVSSEAVRLAEPMLQKAWEGLGGKGVNPWNHDPYGERDDSDIQPLSEALYIVREWLQHPIAEGDRLRKAAEMWLHPEESKMKAPNYSMYGWALRKAADIYQQSFCFDCNVFNCEAFNYSIPEDVTGFFAVMVDLHN